MVSHMQIPTRQGEENNLIERGKKVVRAVANKESIIFH